LINASQADPFPAPVSDRVFSGYRYAVFHLRARSAVKGNVVAHCPQILYNFRREAMSRENGCLSSIKFFYFCFYYNKDKNKIRFLTKAPNKFFCQT